MHNISQKIIFYTLKYVRTLQNLTKPPLSYQSMLTTWINCCQNILTYAEISKINDEKNEVTL